MLQDIDRSSYVIYLLTLLWCQGVHIVPSAYFDSWVRKLILNIPNFSVAFTSVGKNDTLCCTLLSPGRFYCPPAKQSISPLDRWSSLSQLRE